LGYKTNFSLIYSLLTTKEINPGKDELNSQFYKFGLYNLILISISAVLAKLLKFIVSKLNLDLRYSNLEQSNYWFLVFSGRILSTTFIKKGEIDFVFVDLKTKDDIIYSGILMDYHYSATSDSIVSITLGNAKKRICFKETESENTTHTVGAPHDISGDIFILPGEQIVNYNIAYFSIKNMMVVS
jgi:hypothetical protein